MTQLGDDFREWQLHKRKQKADYDNLFFSRHLPALERRVNRFGLEIKQLSPSHWRISNEAGDYVDFWQTLTFKRKGQVASWGFDYLEEEMKKL